MTTIDSFVNRLAKIDIKVTLIGNYPWVYLDTVNDRRVEGLLRSEHAFTIFFRAIKPGQVDKITDIPIIFEKIRETIKLKQEYLEYIKMHPIK